MKTKALNFVIIGLMFLAAVLLPVVAFADETKETPIAEKGAEQSKDDAKLDKEQVVDTAKDAEAVDENEEAAAKDVPQDKAGNEQPELKAEEPDEEQPLAADAAALPEKVEEKADSSAEIDEKENDDEEEINDEDEDMPFVDAEEDLVTQQESSFSSNGLLNAINRIKEHVWSACNIVSSKLKPNNNWSSGNYRPDNRWSNANYKIINAITYPRSNANYRIINAITYPWSDADYRLNRLWSDANYIINKIINPWSSGNYRPKPNNWSNSNYRPWSNSNYSAWSDSNYRPWSGGNYSAWSNSNYRPNSGNNSTAKANRIVKVQLTFETNGGTLLLPKTYPKGTTVILDMIPIREGYRFIGWFADKELTKRIYEVIVLEDMKVYAGWEKLQE